MLIRTMKKMLPYIGESLCDRRYETVYFIWDTYFILCMKLVRDTKPISKEVSWTEHTVVN